MKLKYYFDPSTVVLGPRECVIVDLQNQSFDHNVERVGIACNGKIEVILLDANYGELWSDTLDDRNEYSTGSNVRYVEIRSCCSEVEVIVGDYDEVVRSAGERKFFCDGDCDHCSDYCDHCGCLADWC